MRTPKLTLPSGLQGFTDTLGRFVCTGAQMGRVSTIPPDRHAVGYMRLERLRIDSGGYDRGGAYWGLGLPLYWAYGWTPTTRCEIFIRARDRLHAKTQVLTKFPEAKFYQ